MYRTLVASIKNLKNIPEAAIAPVNVDQLQCTWVEPKYAWTLTVHNVRNKIFCFFAVAKG
jgi:hypothetical protein